MVGLHIMREGTAHLVRHQDDGAAIILQSVTAKAFYREIARARRVADHAGDR